MSRLIFPFCCFGWWAGLARPARCVYETALNHFKVMGALAKALGGKEWLETLHGILHPDGERFAFEWSWLAPSGLSVQDVIAPSSFRFGEARKFTMADKFCAVSFLQISAPEMDDRMPVSYTHLDVYKRQP